MEEENEAKSPIVDRIIANNHPRVHSTNESQVKPPKPPPRSNLTNSSPNILIIPKIEEQQTEITEEIQPQEEEKKNEFLLEDFEEDSKPVGFLGLIPKKDNEVVQKLSKTSTPVKPPPPQRNFFLNETKIIIILKI